MSNKTLARFNREKKALVPNQKLIESHPLKELIRRRSFAANLKYGRGDDARVEDFMTPLRTIVSKTYTEFMRETMWRTRSLFETRQEREQHIDWMFDQLEKYLKDTRALVKSHMAELSEDEDEFEQY